MPLNYCHNCDKAFPNEYQNGANAECPKCRKARHLKECFQLCHRCECRLSHDETCDDCLENETFGEPHNVGDQTLCENCCDDLGTGPGRHK
jgi:hypothetical protein